MNIDALLEDYMNDPKWTGKIFMKDEKTCFIDGLIAGAKAMQDENERLKTKLENTERKIREISQKCYEVEGIEIIISDLDNLAMEVEE